MKPITEDTFFGSACIVGIVTGASLVVVGLFPLSSIVTFGITMIVGALVIVAVCEKLDITTPDKQPLSLRLFSGNVTHSSLVAGDLLFSFTFIVGAGLCSLLKDIISHLYKNGWFVPEDILYGGLIAVVLTTLLVLLLCLPEIRYRWRLRSLRGA